MPLAAFRVPCWVPRPVGRTGRDSPGRRKGRSRRRLCGSPNRTQTYNPAVNSHSRSLDLLVPHHPDPHLDGLPGAGRQGVRQGGGKVLPPGGRLEVLLGRGTRGSAKGPARVRRSGWRRQRTSPLPTLSSAGRFQPHDDLGKTLPLGRRHPFDSEEPDSRESWMRCRSRSIGR